MPATSAAKKKLLLVLGAGSSIPCGMPSVGEIDALMKEWSSDWTHRPEFPKGAIGRGTFNDLWNFLDGYMQRNPRPQLGLRINFERILGEMTSLASWVTPGPFGNALQDAVRDGRPSTAFTWPPDREGDFYYRHLVIEQLSDLLARLATFMRQRCLAFDAASENFASYRAIIESLRSEFEVGIYNLNYDNMALQAWPEAFTGFTGEAFNAREIAQRQEWSFIYHLHGSVHYSLTDPPMMHAIKWKGDLAGTFEDCRPLMPNMASNFIPIVPTTLIAGGYKLDQLLSDPAQSFYAALVRHVHQADAILCAGYGFGDVHVNRALQNRFYLSPYDPNGRPPVVIMTKTPPSAGLIGDRQGYEYYAWELTHTINTRFPSIIGTPGPELPLAQLIEQNRLEQDNFKRAAIWHGGFVEARDHLQQVIAWLRR